MTAPTTAAAPSAPVSPAHARRLLVVLLVCSAVANVAYTILIPFVPTLRDAFAMSPLLIGLAFGGFAATKAVTQPLGGWSVDRWGPRPCAIAGLGATAAATVALAYADDGVEIVVLRLLWGVGEGFAIPALYRLTSTLGALSGVGPSRAMGWFGSAAVTGMAMGPGLVMLLDGRLTFTGAFLISGGLTALAAGALAAGLRGVPGDADEPQSSARPGAVALTGTRLVLFTVVAGGLLDFVNNLVYAALEPVFPLYAADELQAGQRSVAAVLFAGLVLFAVFSALGGALVARVGASVGAALSMFVQAVALVFAALAATFDQFAVAFVALMIAQPIVYVAARTAIAQVRAGQQGRAFGWFGFLSDLGWVLGPVAASVALPAVGGSIFLILGVLAAVTAAAAWGVGVFRRKAMVSD